MKALPAMDVAGRAGRLRGLFGEAEVDALLVTSLPNVRYLTSFTGSAGMLLVTPDALVFTTDGRYRMQSAEQLAAAAVDAEIEVGATISAQREALARALDAGARVGLEAHAITWSQQRAFAEAFAGHDLVATEGIVERLRRVKEPGEVARIHAACGIADDALAAMLPRLADARHIWDVVRESQWAGREAVRAGIESAEVDRACRDVIVAAGWCDSFVHGTGHGVGLEIHEAPRVAATARDTLERGSVVTVEPGVYLPGVGGVRIEDTVVVTPDGSDPLTAFPKELVL